jgi:16S rRNA A1518/A1519 N6-dimethyltransferase RsmA/KsgA/DIM1 with predicted DNA glycosylase/AP lyase activity
MIPINRRANAMFEQIAQHVDFTNKVVMDIGSGYCDLAMKAVDAGAAKVLCLEKSPAVFDQALRKIEDTKYGTFIEILNIDAEDLIHSLVDSYRVDIAFCTSVLPYLRSPEMMIKWMAEHADVSLIEVQYIGDGPGDDFLIEDE